jgi:maleate cis-trans isomerase
VAFTNWRGVVGCIKPNLHAGSTEDLIRLLPDGVGLIPLFLDLPQERGEARLAAARTGYEEKIRELAEKKVDLILPDGTALFMLPGVEGEREMIGRWEERYKTPIFTSGMSLIGAMGAMKFKKVIGIRPYTWTNGADFTLRYLAGAGFDMLCVVSPEGYDYRDVQNIPSVAVYQTAKKAFLAHREADGICILASIMRIGDRIQTIEDDLGLPVVSALTARCWQIQKQLHIRSPLAGYGRLLRDLP